MPAQPPLRVVLDAHGRVPARGPLFHATLAPTLVVTTDAVPAAATDAWAASGAKVETIAAAPIGPGVDLDALTLLLGRHGVLHALVEGGATLLGAVMRERIAQRLVAYVAPTLLGARGLPGFAFDGPATIADAARFQLVATRQIGDDVRLDLEVNS
jgi:diaminohydroxyphosphoribosylaminopyrimidine deaminase / 5-amino-6-(5-phosphoribosylamino)uracil reductase